MAQNSDYAATAEPAQRAGFVPNSVFGLYKVWRSFRKRRRGASAVEFAVVAPVFFLLVLGMIEYGRMVMVQQVITNASREGARRAVLDGATDAAVRTTVLTYLTNGQVNGASRTVTVTPSLGGTVAAGTPLAITVSVTFNDVSWMPSPMFLSGKVLTSTTTMRKESGT